ncbi:hypothetical protein D3C81_1941740 [compost metagenome]
MLFGGQHNRFGDRVLRAGFNRRNQSQHFAVLKTFSGNEIGEFWTPFGQGASFVEGDNAHVTQRLQGFPFTEQYAKFSGAPGTDHN